MKHRKPNVPVTARDVPPERKALYHAGMAVGVVGVLLFVSNFFVIASGFDDPFSMRDGATGFVGRALGGMALIVAGGAMRTVAARGLAGSGLTLNPEQARRDMEPWSRMGGGMLADALDEIPAVRPADERVVEVVRVRCPSCRALNDEDDKFCGQCGGRL
ncbi:zinc ribbon domain-containing protein [Paludisphaera sp.]|uniref:zinc ribbon domain-containing protein n=1 Tax=Paludisphaera sp. TaxID=2017432 RepID=UPI00301B8A39